MYRLFPLTEKRSKEKFKKSVEKALCSETVLTKEVVRKFARRARQYKLFYKSKDDMETDSSNEAPHPVKTEVSAVVIEKVIKTFKMHRSAEDFDAGFIGKVVDRMKTYNSSND